MDFCSMHMFVEFFIVLIFVREEFESNLLMKTGLILFGARHRVMFDEMRPIFNSVDR